MAAFFVSHPVKSIDGAVCKHLAAFNPIIFQFGRQDYSFNLTTDVGGFTKITLTAAVSSDFTIGDSVFFHDYTNGIHQAGTVTAIPAADELTLDIPYQGFTTSGWINSDSVRKNYYIQIKIEKLNPYPNSLAVVSEIARPIFRPSADGYIRCDVYSYIWPQSANENTFPYNVLNSLDLEAGGLFKISYRELWVGLDPSGVAFIDLEMFYWNNAVKQILDMYSGNMADYTLQIYSPVYPPDLIKFCSDFESPTLFPGFPFDLAFNYWDETAVFGDAADINRVRHFKDLNGATLSTIDYTPLDKNQRNFVNRMTIHDALPAGTKFMDVWIDDGDGIIAPPGMFKYKVPTDLSHGDGYGYHSIERSIETDLPCKFTISHFTIDAVDQLSGLPTQEIEINTPADVNYIIGLNGSVQFRNLTDLVNSLCDPLILRFYDDFAIHWRDCTAFTLKIDYEKPTGSAARSFQYTQAGFEDLPSHLFTPVAYDPY